MYLFSEKADRTFLVVTLLWGILLGLLYAVTYKPHYDINQMLERAFQLVEHGNLICYGNASSAGMGKVPGCLSSLLVGVPMLLWNSPYAALLFLMALQGMALFIIADAFKDFFNKKTILIFIFVFWLSPWRLHEIYLWNPSYLFLAMALHIWSAARLKSEASFWPSFIHVLSIGFAFQIHNSSIILAFISLLLFWKKALRVHWLGVFTAGLITLGSLLPYFIAMVENPDISPEIREDKYFLFRGLLYVFPMLKAIWYWVRFSGAVFPKRIFQLLEYSWIGNDILQMIFNYFWVVVKYSVAIASVVFSFKANKYFVKKYKNILRFWNYKYSSDKEWLQLYTVLTFLAVLMAAAISPIDLIFWHLIIIYPVAHIPLLLFFESKGKGWPIQKFVVVCFLYFSIYNILSALGSDRFSIHENPQRDYIEKFYSDH